jgi:hypothetical protein
MVQLITLRFLDIAPLLPVLSEVEAQTVVSQAFG